MKTDLFNHSCTFLAAGSEIADQDSLDGQLPSNRHSAVGHDPPGRPISPPAPPPGGPEPPPNFEKAPAKVKKHRRFHKDQSQESGESSEDVEQKLSSSNSHLSKASGGGANTVTTNASKSPSGNKVASATMGKSSSSHGDKNSSKKTSPANSKAGSVININPFSGQLWERREALYVVNCNLLMSCTKKSTTYSSHLWVAMSSMYGKLLVLLMVAFCLTEVMDNKIKPLAFQVNELL